MKLFLGLLIGLVLGAGGYHLYLNRNAALATTPVEAATPPPTPAPAPSPAPAPPPETRTPETRSLAERATDTTGEIKKRIVTKAEEWRLGPDDIKRELRAGGQIVREKAGAVGGKIADARIITVIKSKYVLDRDLSASGIRVECRNGHVVLSGDVPSVDHIGKALMLAIETDGVVNVSSHLKAPLL